MGFREAWATHGEGESGSHQILKVKSHQVIWTTRSFREKSQIATGSP